MAHPTPSTNNRPTSLPTVTKYEFTETLLRKLPASAKPGSCYIHRDTAGKTQTDTGTRAKRSDWSRGHLAIRVTATGYKSFLFCYRSDDFDKHGKRKERRIELGIQWVGGEATLDEARRAVEERRVALREDAQSSAATLSTRERRRADNVHKAKAKAVDEAHIDMTHLARRYIEEYAKVRKRTWLHDERRLHRVVLPTFGHRKVHSIERNEIAAWLAPVAAGNAALGIRPRPSEANNRLALIRKLFSFAVDQGIVKEHPCLRMPAPGGPTPERDRALEKESEYRLFWRITDRFGPWAKAKPEGRRTAWSNRLPPDVAEALRVVLLTGARVQEVVALKWSEVDMLDATWTLPKERSKNKKTHIVPLTEPVMSILRRRKRTSSSRFVFPGHTDATSLRADYLAHKLKDVIDRLHKLARIDGDAFPTFTTHDLRRTVETGMAKLRVPKEYRDRVLNHAGNSVGGRNYNKYDYLPEKREALEKWATYLEERIGRKLAEAEEASNVVPIRRAQAV